MLRSDVSVVLASTLSGMAEFLDRYGLTLPPLLAEAGLEPGAPDEPKRYVPLAKIARLFELGAERSGDLAFGLNYGALPQQGLTGLLAQAVLTAPTVGVALQALARYLPVYMSGAEASFTASAEGGRLTFSMPEDSGAKVQFLDFALALVCTRFTTALGSRWVPLEVATPRREPADRKAFERVLGRAIVFGQPQISIQISSELIAQAMPNVLAGVHETVCGVAEQVLRNNVAPITMADRRNQIEHLITERIADGRPFDLATMAKSFKVAPRTFQHRLGQAGTSYEQVLSEARRRLAEHYLTNTGLPMSEIAERLRFSEPSAFTRAVRKWFGVAPSRIRASLVPGRRPPFRASVRPGRRASGRRNRVAQGSA